MALIPCPDCGRQVSDAAPTCPGCGRPNVPGSQVGRASKGTSSWRLWLLIPVILLGSCLGMAVIGMHRQHADEQRAQEEHAARQRAMGCLEHPLNPGCDSTTAPADTTPAETLTMHTYDRLQSGMSYYQAEQVLARPGKEVSRSEVGGITTVAYTWDADRCCGSVTVMFQNDELMQKSQAGLK